MAVSARSGYPPGSRLAEIFSELRLAHRNQELPTIWEVHGTPPRSAYFTRFASQQDRLWFYVLRAVAIYDALWVPVLVTFLAHEGFDDLPYRRFIHLVEFLGGVLYIGGTFLRFTTSLVDLQLGREYVDPCDVLLLQLCRSGFWADLFSLPGNFWWCFDCQPLAVLRLLRLWRLPSSVFREYEVMAQTSQSFFLAIVEQFASVFLVAHFFGCAWYFVATWAVHDLKQLFDEESDANVTVGLLDLSYRQCLQYGAAMLVGWNAPQPISADGGYTPPEQIYCMICGPTSSLFMAWVFARLLVAVDKAEEAWRGFMERLTKIQNVLNSLNVPEALRHRVLQYHAFLGVHNVDKEAYDVLFQGLSTNLHVELKLFLFEQLVLQAPFFQAVPARVVMTMVRAFEMEVFSPGDMILKKGDIGQEMFFLMKGGCDVLIDDEATLVVADKKMGDYFGEVALVFENQVRTAWVCARVFCVLAKLTKAAFDEALKNAPQVREMMIMRIEQQQQVKNPAQQSAVQLSERSRKAAAGGHLQTSPLLEA